MSRKLSSYSIALLLAILCIGYTQAQNYLPQSGGEVIEHSYYTLAYSEEHEQAEWVYYHVSPSSLSGTASRSDNFRVDDKVSTGSATLADYVGSGYDRGHLCPAASMSINSTAMSESFYMSNMSPQHPSLNRGMWKKLEEHVRDLALADSMLHVISGPVLSSSIGTIGANNVTVPEYYYKVIYSPKKQQMIGYVMQNCKLPDPLESYATTVDYIESITGIDFFAQMSDQLEPLEATMELAAWSKDSCVTPSASLSAPQPLNATQPTTSAAQQSDGKCQATTASGSRCTRSASSGSNYCWQHQK